MTFIARSGARQHDAPPLLAGYWSCDQAYEPTSTEGSCDAEPLMPSLRFDLNIFAPLVPPIFGEAMTDEPERPRFREHLHQMGEAVKGLGKDVEMDVADAPHLAKEHTKSALARAAGVQTRPMREWPEPDQADPK
jgi:hypothetical protein